ncbi:hypothetical protein L1049_006277 [Liquidambar formosana]|uniref:Fe2OG dioxygenase domain-containing protein n=1 Tax=Liquidambar formosana TaxID=63359 RepID=A0AAP0RF93_LIQFO
MMMTMKGGHDDYDRAKEVKQFDDSKIGVKGLVDSGITTIPRIFVHQPESLIRPKPTTRSESNLILTIDLSSDCRSTMVDQIRQASSTLGFFQITNHGISQDLLDRMISSIIAFHEQPTEIKARFYHRNSSTGVAYSSNVDLFQSKAASWRDTLQMRMGPTMPEHDAIPEVCRTAVIEWEREVGRVGEVLMRLLCEGLGLEEGRLKEMTCLDGKVMVGHYYPYCPQPDLTLGLAWHTDPGVLTVLLQDQVGGLQVKYGEEYVDVKPLPGALVINIGDILQIISNDEYKSVEHRVLANPSSEPRVSIGVFFNPINREGMYGPLPELIMPEKPAVYRQFIYSEFMKKFFTKELDGKSLPNFYRL